MRIKELIILIVLIIPSTLALFKPGFFGASDDMHIAWLQQIDQAIGTGQIPPRYVADLSFGFGYPLFNFIFPLPYYLGELFHFTGLSFVYSIKAVFVLSLFASAFAMYVLIRHYTSTVVAIAAAVLYVYSPYRSTDIYVRGALGEALAFVFLPLVIYSLIKLSEAKTNVSYKWVGVGSLSIAGLVLTHNIVSYMFIPFALIFGLVVLRKKTMNLLLTFLLGLVGSVYFWLPALRDSRLMKYETVFNFFDHFPTIRQLLIPYWGYGASVPGNYDGMSFFIGEVNLVIIVATTIYLIFNFRKLSGKVKPLIVWGILLIALSIFMMNFRSYWFWQHIPLIAYFQFPWRFLTMIVFASSMMVVAINGFRYSKIFAFLIIILSIGINYYRFKPHDFLRRDDSYYINRYIPVPTPSSEYLGLQEEYLRLPLKTLFRPSEIYPRVFPSYNIENLKLENSLDATFTTNSETSLNLNYNKYFFPGWFGEIDGKELVLSTGNPFGQIQFIVPTGNHEISIKFKETPVNRILDIISLLTLIGCGYLVVRGKSEVSR